MRECYRHHSRTKIFIPANSPERTIGSMTACSTRSRHSRARGRQPTRRNAAATSPPDPPAYRRPRGIPNVRLPPSLDRAIAEIADRQRTLSGKTPARRRQPQAAAEIPAPPSQPMPTQNLAGLEDQLRNITKQIETLRKPGVEQAINALREELSEIGRTLGDAMPRRALEAIEKQIQSLDRRIAEGRQAGIDAATLGGIEHGLAEVRDAMHGLMPAENLIGYTDAVANLAHKIDLIVAQNDPATIAQLERSILTLREMTNHIASNDTVQGLAAQVQALGEKIEYMAQASAGSGEGALNHLEHRIAAALGHAGRARAERTRGIAAAGSSGAIARRQDRADSEFARQRRRLRPSRGSYRQAGEETGRFRFQARPFGRDRARPGRFAGPLRKYARESGRRWITRARRAGRRRSQARHHAHPGRIGSGAWHARPRRRPPCHDRKGYSRRARVDAARHSRCRPAPRRAIPRRHVPGLHTRNCRSIPICRTTSRSNPAPGRRICRSIQPRALQPRKPLSARHRLPPHRAANPASSPPPAAPLRQRVSNRVPARRARNRSRPMSPPTHPCAPR